MTNTLNMKPAVHDILLEIGVEEMPSGPLNAAVAQLRDMVPAALASANLPSGDVRILAGPRRIAVMVEAVADRQPDTRTEFRGPAAAIAFGEDGTMTPAGLGFARGKGATPDDVEVRDVDGTDYLLVAVESKGRPTAEVLPELLKGLITGIDWKRSQRWGSTSERFVRPVRWICALFGDQVVDLEFAGVASGRATYGHRFLAPRSIDLNSMREYVKTLSMNHVVVDPEARRSIIIEEATRAASPYGEVLIVDSVLDEVINLTEFPNAVVGEFEEPFLRVPREILESAMSKHQRYFAIQRPDGTLDNHFVVISNGDPKRADTIANGNARVVRARLSDAAFFFDEDSKVSLEEWRERLGRVVFQAKLGTVLDKADRIEIVATMLATELGITRESLGAVARAAHLCKADLATSAVIEFTELQGVMGGHYARLGGETAEVCTAIAEHYRPRYAGDAIPSSVAGQLVSVADKLDTIVGVFAANKAPKGTSDPFALRRSAIGVLQVGLSGLSINIERAVDGAIGSLAAVDFDEDSVRTAVLDFFRGRLENILRDRGYAYDTVAAVLAIQSAEPADAAARCEALDAFRSRGSEMDDLSTAFSRARNLADPSVGTDVNTALFGPHDADLDRALSAVEGSVGTLAERREYPELLEALASTRTAVDAFFENVMVLSEDEGERRNRLALLNRFVALFERFADFGALSS